MQNYQTAKVFLKRLVQGLGIILLDIVLTAGVLLGIGFYGHGNSHGSEVLSASVKSAPTGIIVPTASPIPSQPLATQVPSSVQPSDIDNAIQTAVANYPGLDFGVSFIDLNSGQQTDVNGDQIFDGASTTKVLIACLLLSRVEQGKYTLQTQLNGTNLQQLLFQMINRSDNDAWETLMNFIGFNYQRPYAQSLGISSYDVSDNRIDPNDMAILLSKLYMGKLLNASDTKLLLSYMQNTNNDDLIPPAVTAGISVYHKYGSFNGDLHDAAIIDNGKNPFVLVIFSTASATLTYTYDQKTAAFHSIVTAVENANGITTP